MEGRKIVLNDGTEYEDSDCGYADRKLWCFVKGISIGEAFAAFSDPEKTKTIRYFYGNTEEIYTGFTELDVLRRSEFTIDVRLVGDETSIESITIDPAENQEEEENGTDTAEQ